MALHPNNVQARATAVEERRALIRRCQMNANNGKDSLLSIMRSLEAASCISQARKLGRIIARLEAWQNGKP